MDQFVSYFGNLLFTAFIWNSTYPWLSPIAWLNSIYSVYSFIALFATKMKEVVESKVGIIANYKGTIFLVLMFVSIVLAGFTIQVDEQNKINLLQQEYSPILVSDNFSIEPYSQNERLVTLYIHNIGAGTAYHFKSRICMAPTNSPETMSVYNEAPNENPMLPHDPIPTTVPFRITTSTSDWLVYSEITYFNIVDTQYQFEYCWHLIIDESKGTYRRLNLSPEAQKAFKQLVYRHMGRPVAN